MSNLNNDYLNDYSKNGYVVLNNIFSSTELEFLRSVFLALYEDSKRVDGDLKVRCYDDYPYITCGGVNVATIEDFSHKLPRRVLDILSKKRIVEHAEELVGRKPLSLKLFRLHVTGKFSYEGPWHRDQELSGEDSDILCNVYINNETGLRFFPKNSSLHEDSSIHFGADIKNIDYDVLSVRAGEVVFFDPKILHKPHSITERLHLHLRFTSNYDDCQDYISYKNNQTFYTRDRSFASGLKRAFRLIKKILNGNSKKIY